MKSTRDTRLLWLLLIACALAACGVVAPPEPFLPPQRSAALPPHPSVGLHRVHQEAKETPPFLTVEMSNKGFPVLVQDRAFITADDIESVQLGDEPSIGKVIIIQFKPEAWSKVQRFTQTRISKPMALVARDQIVSVASVNGVISESMLVTGLDEKEAAASFRLLTRDDADTGE